MNKITDIVTISGLLLTLTTFLFNIAWPHVAKAMSTDIKINGEIAKSNKRKEIWNVILLKLLPIFVGFTVLFYVNLPTSLKIAKNSSFDIWDFDINITLYIFLEITLCALVIFNGVILYNLLRKIHKLK